MKTKNVKFILVLIILFSFPACEDLGIEADKCDRTVLIPSIDVRLTAEVIASDSGENIIPLKVRFFKTACGFETPKPSSTFTYSGEIHRSNGITTFYAGFVTYNLRNEDDIITIELHTDRNQDGTYEIVDSWKSDYLNLDPDGTTKFTFRINN